MYRSDYEGSLFSEMWRKSGKNKYNVLQKRAFNDGDKTINKHANCEMLTTSLVSDQNLERLLVNRQPVTGPQMRLLTFYTVNVLLKFRKHAHSVITAVIKTDITNIVY